MHMKNMVIPMVLFVNKYAVRLSHCSVPEACSLANSTHNLLTSQVHHEPIL